MTKPSLERWLAGVEVSIPWRFQRHLAAFRQAWARRQWPREARIQMGRRSAIGDELLMTALARAVKQHCPACQVTVLCTHTELFNNNPHCDRVADFNRIDAKGQYQGRYVFRVDYLKNKALYVDRTRHLLDIMGDQIGLPVAHRVEIYLSDAERQSAQEFRDTHGPFITLNTRASQWTPNKDWYDDRWQALIDVWSRQYRIVHLGAENEPHFNNVLRLAGETGLRQAFSILHQADCHLGIVSLLMHAAKAVNTPAVIVYGGYESPRMSGYEGNINLYSDIACAPCFDQDCPYDRRCMDRIGVADVQAALASMLLEPRVS